MVDNCNIVQLYLGYTNCINGKVYREPDLYTVALLISFVYALMVCVKLILGYNYMDIYIRVRYIIVLSVVTLAEGRVCWGKYITVHFGTIPYFDISLSSVDI